MRGRVDALRTRDGHTIPYEHKRGRSHRDDRHCAPTAWESDRIQVLAYACLLESAKGITIPEGRIRYHADNVLVRVPLDDSARAAVREAVQTARSLRMSTQHPPSPTTNACAPAVPSPQSAFQKKPDSRAIAKGSQLDCFPPTTNAK